MPQKFDPAPLDRTPTKRPMSRLVEKRHANWTKGPEDSFPASNPVSGAQPKKNKEIDG